MKNAETDLAPRTKMFARRIVISKQARGNG
jgi:hypothetical protein